VADNGSGVLAAVLGLGPSLAFASDKSSTRPNVISVPSGPGSITGLGESFEANLNSRVLLPLAGCSEHKL